MTNRFQHELRREFDLTPAMAVWIVATHFFVLACPLTMIWAVYFYGDSLPTPMAHPVLVMIASAVYIGATAFEVAQNSADRWYLTEATRSVADLFFNSFLTIAFWLYLVGFAGLGWLALAMLIPTLLYPVAYINDHPSHRGLNGIVALSATVSLWLLTDDPTALFFLIGTGVGVFFITYLIKRHAQSLHGWGALFFGLSFLAWPWSIANAARNESLSWTAFIISCIAIVISLVVMMPKLEKMPSTARQQ